MTIYVINKDDFQNACCTKNPRHVFNTKGIKLQILEDENELDFDTVIIPKDNHDIALSENRKTLFFYEYDENKKSGTLIKAQLTDTSTCLYSLGNGKFALAYTQPTREQLRLDIWDCTTKKIACTYLLDNSALDILEMHLNADGKTLVCIANAFRHNTYNEDVRFYSQGHRKTKPDHTGLFYIDRTTQHIITLNLLSGEYSVTTRPLSKINSVLSRDLLVSVTGEKKVSCDQIIRPDELRTKLVDTLSSTTSHILPRELTAITVEYAGVAKARMFKPMTDFIIDTEAHAKQVNSIALISQP